MKFKMVHENYNVQNLEKSLAFYEKALGLTEKRRKTAPDGSFIIVFIGNDASEFELELTWLANHPQKYDIGEEEFHLAFHVDDFNAAHELHEKMGCICYENHSMGIYFIQDPDGYWLEVIPAKRQMEIYDISREIFNSKLYPGDPVPEHVFLSNMKNGDSYNLSKITLCSHSATHVDAPFHFFEDGKTITDINLEKFIGECIVLTHAGKVLRNDIKNAVKNSEIKKILIRGEIEITEEAAEEIANEKLELLGVEGLTVGTEETLMKIHKILLKNEIVILECLDLSEIKDGVYFLFAAPLKLGGLDGAPCRAVLFR